MFLAQTMIIVYSKSWPICPQVTSDQTIETIKS